MRTTILTVAAVTALGCGATRKADDQLTGVVPLDGDDDAAAFGGSSSGAATTDAAEAGGETQGDGDANGETTADAQFKWDVGWGDDSGGMQVDDCESAPAEDADGDGYTKAGGDCNDCDPNVNPGAIEVVQLEPDRMGVVPDPADENCDGAIDNVAPPCDGTFAIDDDDPLHAAAAIGLCKAAQGPDDWGLVDAQWVRADGTPASFPNAQHGIMFAFGPNVSPREGTQHLVMSTGRARTTGMVNACLSNSCSGLGPGTPPAGFPQDVPACPGATNINDDVALEVTLRAPSNATGFSYDFDFYSFEYPEWVCTSYNDQYLAIVNPPPVGAINGNISFDAASNPVSVNIAFFEVCAGCTLGASELQGTGFDVLDDAGATSWLQTTAPVEAGSEITIRFAIFDTGDDAWDSTVLIDNFQWIATEGTPSVGTVPEG